MVKLGKLKTEGVLQNGDTFTDSRLGLCKIIAIDSASTLTVKAQNGKYYRISGLSLT